MSGFLAVISFSLTHWISARSFLVSSGETPGKEAVLQALISVLRGQLGYFTTLLPRVSWFMVVAFGVGFAFLVWFTIMRSLDNRRTWMLFVVKLVLSLLSIVILFNLPVSVWSISTRSGVMPVFSSLLAVSAIALLVASWKAQAVMDDPRDEIDPVEYDDEYLLAEEKPAIYDCMRVVGVFIAPLLIVLILVGGALNLRAVLRDDGSFMDRAAEGVVSGLGERKWSVSNRLIDSHL